MNTTKRKIDELYHRHKKLITNRVNSWRRTTGREFDDLLGVCEESFMECIKRFRPDGGSKFSSLMATICNQRISRYCKKNDQPKELENTDPGIDPKAEIECTWQETKRGLSDNARTVVNIILNSPQELIDVAGSMKHKDLTKALEDTLRRNGYRGRRMQAAFREIRTTLRREAS